MTGLQTQGIKKSAMMGPLIALSSPVPVCITAGDSCYDIAKGLAINEDERLLEFYNHLIMQRRSQESELTIRSRLDGIYVKDTLINEEYRIRLCRTLRVPEVGSSHNIPATFGPLPHIDISKCAGDNVPDSMKKKGGLMVPMLQREAMCITFSSPKPRKYKPRDSMDCHLAIRLYAGGANVITGKRSIEQKDQKQDYYIAPLQNRVDGFGGALRHQVKQFVAMPVGAGYSVESQITGGEFGGIQFHIAPRMKDCVQWEQVGAGRRCSQTALDLRKTPRELLLRAEQYVRLTEEPGVIAHVPWTWEPGKTIETELMDTFHSWAFWTKSKCTHELQNDSSLCCRDNQQYPSRARPAMFSDLFNEADLEPQGTLVVSAVPPIQVILRHLAEAKESLSTSINVSPFESAAVFLARVNHKMSGLHHKQPGIGIKWEIQNQEWQQYLRDVTNAGLFVPIHSLGVTDGHIIETVPSYYKILPIVLSGHSRGRPLAGWDMSLCAGSELDQTVKEDPIPEDWNWEAAQFVNVQILNTVAFESVTGLAAPASPISFEEYTKAGIPSLSGAEMSEGIGGKFPAVRTIANIDYMLGVNNAVRLDPSGKPVGCVICERKICDSMQVSPN